VEVEFIPAEWVERAAWSPGLRVFSRPITVERRVDCRRKSDVEQLLQTLLRAA
jgi:hypothetical protein